MLEKYLHLAQNRPLGTSAEEKAEYALRARQRAERKIEEREHLRLELKAREYIRVCHEVIDTLKAGVELPGTNPVPGSPVIPAGTPLGRGRIQSLKAAMDGSLRLLDRVLPPLKAVEMGDSPEKQAEVTKMTTADLVRAIMREQSIPGEAEVIEDEPTSVPEKLPW